MKLTVFLLEGFAYRAMARRIPFVVRVSSDKNVEVSTTIHLNQALLIHTDDDDLWFGSDRHILSRLGDETLTISPERPHCILGCVEIDDADATDCVAGRYRLKAGVTVFERSISGKFHAVSLEATTNVSLRDTGDE